MAVRSRTRKDLHACRIRALQEFLRGMRICPPNFSRKEQPTCRAGWLTGKPGENKTQRAYLLLQPSGLGQPISRFGQA